MRICKLIKWRPALGVLAVGVFACSLALEGASDDKAGGKGTIGKVRAKVEAGYQIRADQIPRAPAVNAYRSLTVLDREGKIPLLRGPTGYEPMGGIAAPRTGGPAGCEENAQCDDCNDCTSDECVNEVCVYTSMAECERCDDDLYCNGGERCGSEAYGETQGVCLPATEIDDPPLDPCAIDPLDYVCDELAEEGAGDCVPGCCDTEEECDITCDDELWCTGVETCEEKRCIGGPNDTLSCSVNAYCCTGGDCDDDPVPKPMCRGLCRTAGPPCGVGVLCMEEGHICDPGRCCTGTGYADCARETKPLCAGKWLGVGTDEDTCEDLAPSTEPNAGEDFDCPRYESGITSGTVIDVTDEAGVADCRPYREVGDDYTVDVPTDYFQVTTFRWIGGHDAGTGSRMRITFYDAQGAFIEDTITETSYLDGVAFRTVIYDEMPVIPAQGIVTVSAAEEFSPDSRQRWAVTDTLNVGDNDNTEIYVDRGDGSGLVAVSAAGEGLAGGTLAFEIVGQEHGPPVGACCNTVTGICEEKVPWICEQENGFFQGIGTSCNVCSNFPMDVDCSSEAECLLCLEGGRIGEPCLSNPNACPDGSCVEGVCDENSQNAGEPCDCPDSECDAGTCEVVPPACQRTACCDPNSGACTEVTGGFCSNTGTCTGGGSESCGIDADCPVGETCTAATVCISDDDCGGTCEAPCLRGYVSQGFGTECTKNNCCIQPIETGADTCDNAYMHIIPVPTPGDPAITITITGNNKAATFGDSYYDECEGGFNDTGSCDPDIDCTGGGRCVDGFCLEGTNPGSPCDPNKQCCPEDNCTGDPETDGTCTAGATCDSGLFDPEGAYLDRGWWEAFSIDACADVRIDLCCTKEISGEIHQPQWDAIISDCDPCGGFIGTSIVGSHSVGIDTDSYARGYPFCVCDDLWRTFRALEAGTYYHHVFTATGGHFGEYQLHITVGACPQAACCLPTATCIPGTENQGQPCERDSECDSTPELGDCKPDCGLMNQTDCDVADGYWLGFGNIPGTTDPVADCGNNCDIGSCCTGPGACEDRSGTADCVPANPATCMDRELCETMPNGSYAGGAMCEWPAAPCPACAIEGELNCQLGAFQGTHQSDLTIPPYGVVAADDFIPSSNQISSVCAWGMYMDANLPLATPAFGCDGVVEDNFRVRVYTDAGGFPGAVVSGGERWIIGDDVVRGDIGLTYYDMPINSYTLFFDPPIDLPDVGVTYWLEVANKTDILTGGTEPTLNTCYWEWNYQADGNDYSVQGTGDRPDDQGGGVGYFPSAASARSEDMAFCLGAPGMAPLNFTVADTALGSCCTCDAGCVPGQILDDCDTDLIGTWYLDDGCPGELCQPQDGETCVPGGVVFGEVAGRGLDCSEEPGPGGGAIKVPREGGFYGFDTSCVPTDGPSVTKGVGPDIFVNDIWFEYVTNCTGRLVVSMCPTGNADGAYDSLLALYSDRSKTCSCPTGSTTQQGEARDETCNGILDAGAGFDDANIVKPGECWLIRVGGFFQNPGNDAGAGMVDIDCVAADCTPSNMPEPDTIVYPGDPPVVVENQKIRYLSVKVAEADAGLDQAIRVTMEDLPSPYDTWNGTVMYVGPPDMYCENSGVKKPPCPPAQPTREFKAATLECSAEVRDWSAEGIVHVFHEGIVPGGVYHVQAAAGDCSLDVDASWSDPLVVTMSKWGDLVRSCGQCPCTPPDVSVDIATDVTAVLDKFRNLGPPDVSCAPVTKARADHDLVTPNQLIDISDATCCLDAFRGWPYPPPSFPLPGAPPCSAAAVADGQ